jgi:peroxiredoxin family protein
MNGESDGAAILVMSGDMDRMFAALSIANGAAAMGMETTLFFSFWAVCALRVRPRQGTSKGWIERAIAWALPAGAGTLPVSRMNYGGAGAWFFRWWMKRQHMQTLGEMLADAQEMGVKLVACEVSMQMMGLRRGDLMEGVEFGGVARFVKEARHARLSLFI